MLEAHVAAAQVVLDWVVSQGGYAHPTIRVCSDAWGGLGIMVMGGSGLCKNEEILRVPRGIMLECPSGTPQQLQHAALALRLLDEVDKGALSPWSSYLACLPTEAKGLRHMPLVWHCEEQQWQTADGTGPNVHSSHQTMVQRLLHASQHAGQVFEQLCSRVQQEYSQLPQLLSTLEKGVQNHNRQLPTWKSYIWARSIVASRAMHLWSGPTLVPLADFLNHASLPNVLCRCHTQARSIYSPPSTPSSTDDESDDEQAASPHQVTQGQAFVCEAVRDVPVGQELLWAYNSHRHDGDWLVGYGWVPCDGSSAPVPAVEELCQGDGGRADVSSGKATEARLSQLQEALHMIAGLTPELRQRAFGIEVLLQREHQVLSLDHAEAAAT